MGMKMNVSHILVSQKFAAEDLVRKLNEGADFHDLAQKHSTCPSAKDGGRLGLIDLNRLDDDFREAAEVLKPLEKSPIVRTRFGYHLILREA